MLKHVKKRILRKHRKFKGLPITIISNNCFAGMWYKEYNQKYDSPTIGLFIRVRDFLNFINCLEEYCKSDLIWDVKTEETYPVALISNNGVSVMVHFMHYSDAQQAENAWKRRCKRIHQERLVSIFIQTPQMTKEDIYEYDRVELKGQRKILVLDNKWKDNYELTNTYVIYTDAFHWEEPFSWDFGKVERSVRKAKCFILD